MTACTDEYIQYVSAMTPADFHERIAFKFVDGGDGNMPADSPRNRRRMVSLGQE